MSLQWYDAIDEIIKVNFFDSQRQDITVSLTHAHDNRIMHELSRLPGVLQSEPVRVVNAEFHAANRSHNGNLQGILAQSILTPVNDTKSIAQEYAPPTEVKIVEMIHLRSGLICIKMAFDASSASI